MAGRVGGRRPDELRPLKAVRGFTKWAEGSVLMQAGDTWVVCTVSVDARVPLWLKGQGQGWISAEYGMLPRSTQERQQRDNGRGRPSGRTLEIQRLVGRALRSVVDLRALGEHTLWVDCDVLQADGGTRTAAVTGSFLALVEALVTMFPSGPLPIWDFLAAVSVGQVGGERLLDLDFSEDSRAEVDMNLVATGRGQWVEIQGTAEGAPFSREDLEDFLELGGKGLQ